MSENMKFGEIRVIGKSVYTLRKKGRFEDPCGRCVFDKFGCRMSKSLKKTLGKCSYNSCFDKPTIQEMIDWIMKEFPESSILITKDDFCGFSIQFQIDYLDNHSPLKIKVDNKNTYKAFEQLFVRLYNQKDGGKK